MPSLTNRDLKILETLYTSRYMTTPQIAALFWRESKDGTKDPEAARLRACQRRLKILEDEELIRPIELPVKKREATKSRVWTLDHGSVIWLEDRGIPPKEIDWKPKPSEESYPFLQHLLDTNGFRIDLSLACESLPDVELYEWEDEKELRSDADRVELPIPKSRNKTESVAIVPDARFVLRRGKVEAYFLVEIDRSTVTEEPTKWETRGWRKKSLAYVAYYSQRTRKEQGQRLTAYQERYGTSSLRILVVTSGSRRFANMKSTTEKAGGQNRFCFTTFDAITPETVLTSPIWTQASTGKQIALID